TVIWFSIDILVISGWTSLRLCFFSLGEFISLRANFKRSLFDFSWMVAFTRTGAWPNNDYIFVVCIRLFWFNAVVVFRTILIFTRLLAFFSSFTSASFLFRLVCLIFFPVLTVT